MKKVKFIYNPNSGEKRVVHELDYINYLYQEYGYIVVPHRLSETSTIEHALIDIHENYEHILIAGGDGTVNILLNAMKKLDIDLPIGILPTGTANDFAKMMNIPFDTKGAIESIIKSKPHYIDIGQMNDKYFINVASAGMFTDVSQKINPDIKNSIGKVSYYIKGIEEALHLRAFNVNVESEEICYNGDMYLMLIFNGKYAGNISLAYKAELDDGYLDVIIFRAMPLPKSIPVFINVLRGQHLDYYNEEEMLYFKTKKVNIACSDNLLTDIDGEKGSAFPLEIKCIKDGIQILGYDK